MISLMLLPKTNNIYVQGDLCHDPIDMEGCYSFSVFSAFCCHGDWFEYLCCLRNRKY